MPLNLLPVVRVILLIAAVTAVLQATVLNGWAQRAIFNRLATFGQPASARRFPDPRMARVFPLFMALVFLAVWWYLGTAGGVNWVRPATTRRHNRSRATAQAPVNADRVTSPLHSGAGATPI
jgi:hypothetical protein